MSDDKDRYWGDSATLRKYGLAGRRTLCTSPERPEHYKENEPSRFDRRNVPTYGDMLADGFNASII